jgi:hypothetical protein
VEEGRGKKEEERSKKSRIYMMFDRLVIISAVVGLF